MNDLQNFLSNYIDWIKAFHVIAVIAWMSGMLYLPRLFVYHTETTPGAADSERFKVMEWKLIRVIINPSMIAVWILGPMLAWLTGTYLDHWLQVKFVFVILLSGTHGLFVTMARQLQRDERRYSARVYRIWNEVPAALMAIIVILVIVQPF